MDRNSAKHIALGGVTAALAIVIFCLGGLIPIATYATPMLCTLLLQVILKTCGKRIAWAWYGAVALLALLLSPDKEASLIFLFLGYYPICKPTLDKSRLKLLWKLLLFNAAILCVYGLLILVTGTAALLQDYREVGLIGLGVMLILGNITFILLDILLGRKFTHKI